MEEKQEWPLPMLLAPEPPLVNACQPTFSAPLRDWQPWVGWALSLPQPVHPSLPPRSLCPAWRKALLSSAAPRPKHLELLCRVCGYGSLCLHWEQGQRGGCEPLVWEKVGCAGPGPGLSCFCPPGAQGTSAEPKSWLSLWLS